MSTMNDIAQDQLRTLAVFAHDPDFAMMAANQLFSASSADEVLIVCYDGTKLHSAEVTRNTAGGIHMSTFIDGEWPYQHPIVGKA